MVLNFLGWSSDFAIPQCLALEVYLVSLRFSSLSYKIVRNSRAHLIHILRGLNELTYIRGHNNVITL